MQRHLILCGAYGAARGGLQDIGDGSATKGPADVVGSKYLLPRHRHHYLARRTTRGTGYEAGEEASNASFARFPSRGGHGPVSGTGCLLTMGPN
jgi:hypothetical protein